MVAKIVASGRALPACPLSLSPIWRSRPSAPLPSTISASQRKQWIKEGKGAIKSTRLSCRTFAANAVRLQLHALAYNIGNFMWTLAMPKAAAPWSLTSLREKLVRIGAKVVSHGRYVTFQMAEVAVPRQIVRRNPLVDRAVAGTPSTSSERRWGRMRQMMIGDVRFDAGKAKRSRASAQSTG